MTTLKKVILSGEVSLENEVITMNAVIEGGKISVTSSSSLRSVKDATGVLLREITVNIHEKV